MQSWRNWALTKRFAWDASFLLNSFSPIVPVLTFFRYSFQLPPQGPSKFSTLAKMCFGLFILRQSMVTLGVGIEEDRCKHYLVSTFIRLGSNDNGLRCIFDSFFVKNIREQQASLSIYFRHRAIWEAVCQTIMTSIWDSESWIKSLRAVESSFSNLLSSNSLSSASPNWTTRRDKYFQK